MKKNKNKNKNIFMLLATQITFVVLLMSVLSASAIATDSGIGIYIDGLKVRVEPIVHSFPRSQLEPESPETIMGRIEYQSIYYMDVEPEIVSGRVFVPIRAISNYFDCYVGWERPYVTLTLGETTITLEIGSNIIMNNESESVLEAAPYLRNNRTMVPLRFISEAFGCTVDYIDGTVYINTPPFYIDDIEIVSLQQWSRMTVGGILSEIKSDIYAKKVYQFIQNSLGAEITVTDDFHFGEFLLTPYGNFYNHQGQGDYSFMETVGLGGKVLQKYEIYRRENDSLELRPWITIQGADFGKWIIYDVTNDKWYQVSNDNFYYNYLDLDSLLEWDDDDWEVILNNVV
ncbi:MAG: copper amine oxidase N-terminal domain-containing protein [Oscillospiraceae bacterium]|nr:copper amine oxidase N-terminal domain-containing protein [Oscillospiraceae bacterium]